MLLIHPTDKHDPLPNRNTNLKTQFAYMYKFFPNVNFFVFLGQMLAYFLAIFQSTNAFLLSYPEKVTAVENSFQI